jgi:probable rRNA maturation factor
LSEKSVTVENRTDFEIDLPQIADLVDFLKGELGIEESIIVDVTFVDADVMADLHIRYMGLMGPTDVLSFPATDVVNGLVYSTSLQDEPTLGDIVICPAFIERGTASDSAQMSIYACVIHAMLHLIGHDHGDAPSRAVMKNQETKLATHWRTAATHEAAQSAKA